MKRTHLAAAGLAALALAACGGSNDAASGNQSAEAASIAQQVSLITEGKSAAEMEAMYASFLDNYISNVDGINLVGYGAVTTEDHAILKAYVASLESRGVAGLSEDEEMAFWINLYNAKTIDIIVENHPLTSIRKIGSFNRGPWDQKVLNVTGIGEMTLNDVEHGTLRANWDEPRIHYAVNCASMGCPNLKATPWTAAALEDDFEDAATTYINHPRGVRVEDGKVTASKIYSWFQEDFGDSEAGVLEHVREYAEGDLKTELDTATDIKSFEYSWDLNGS